MERKGVSLCACCSAIRLLLHLPPVYGAGAIRDILASKAEEGRAHHHNSCKHAMLHTWEHAHTTHHK